jgi:hypothetical protein
VHARTAGFRLGPLFEFSLIVLLTRSSDGDDNNDNYQWQGGRDVVGVVHV